MAVIQLALAAERWRQEVLLYGTGPNGAGADWSDTLHPPTTIGDLAIIEILISVETIATLVAPALLGCQANVVNTLGGNAVVDIIGSVRWQNHQALRASCYFSPDPLVLLRQGEAISIQSPELDSNASPTGDVYYYVKCVRVPMEAPAAPARGPIQLVS